MMKKTTGKGTEYRERKREMRETMYREDLTEVRKLLPPGG
jgi:hypothetical protein